MTATTSNEIGADRIVTVLAASDPATGPPRDIVPARDAANAGGLLPMFRQDFKAAIAAGERAIARVIRRQHDRIARRQTVRELRLLGRSRLADLGIEPDRIEQMVDTMLAAHREGKAMRGGRSRPWSG